MRNHAAEYALATAAVSMNGYDFSYEVTRIQDTNNNTGSWS
jgi:hypothetical protein